MPPGFGWVSLRPGTSESQTLRLLDRAMPSLATGTSTTVFPFSVGLVAGSTFESPRGTVTHRVISTSKRYLRSFVSSIDLR